MFKKQLNIFTFLLLLWASNAVAQSHNHLVISEPQLKTIKKNLGKAPLFDETLAATRKEIDAVVNEELDVPIPKDLAGGYTHSTHKANYQLMEKAGTLYRITGEKKYASFIKRTLFKYAEVYPTLPPHPAGNSYTRGKLFWQCLNDANWLVATAMAYDNIYDFLSIKDREHLETNLFRPFGSYLSIETPHFFNRIHNHSTWACAAVGMIGLVMGDEEMVNSALYGLKNDGIAADKYDNDGALIKPAGQDRSGFLAQIDGLFSPDGLYAEGPYYHRYSIYPFLIFAVSLQNKKPEIDIFSYRDNLLIKSVNTLLTQSDAKGNFFPINDAQKGMSIYNSSLIAAVDIAYFYGKNDPALLTIAKTQKEVLLDASGMAVALNIDKATPIAKQSVVLKDGIDGTSGGVGILRWDKDLEAVFKFGTQGMGHGHFDRLSYSFYDKGKEVLQDYGMARFVNIEQKGGGGYLKENTTFAKQSIAHNTLVVNEKSHFGGSVDEAEKFSSVLNFSDFSANGIQLISATDTAMYKGISATRTLISVNKKAVGNTLLIDIIRVKSDAKNQYDVPIYYQGQPLDASFDYTSSTQLKPLGTKNGYQHIWHEAGAAVEDESVSFSWLGSGKFYTYTAVTTPGDSIIFGRTGATDPSFNLRHDPTLILRKKNQAATLFASVIEVHGGYSPITEKAKSPYGNIKKIEVLEDDENYTVLKIISEDKGNFLIALANKDFSKTSAHAFKSGSTNMSWKGPYHIQKITQ